MIEVINCNSGRQKKPHQRKDVSERFETLL
uniref:Uncharacterized protein n=1 Tax=Parascaris univalens TaxID=6257 RepID=A0A915AKH0_PARUN